MSELKRAYNLMRGYVQREFDRIQSLDREKALEELDAPGIPTRRTPEPTPDTPVVVDAELARSYLGVSADAPFDEIRTKYEDLVARSQPSQFEVGTPEHSQAVAIQRRIHRAYTILTEDVSITEKRFRSLEID